MKWPLITNHQPRSARRGFTLIEMMVATALFMVVMLISVSTLLALVGANRKAQSTQLVIDNLGITLDGMERAIRMGSNYHCSSSTDYTKTYDCSSVTDDPANHYTLAFEPFGYPTPPNDKVIIYTVDPSVCPANRFCKSTDGGVTFLPITAPEVSIQSLQFYVVGTTASDDAQPKVVVVAKGSAYLGSSGTQSTFHIQATAVQRLLDI